MIASGGGVVIRQIVGYAFVEFGGGIAFRLFPAVALQYGLELCALDAQGTGEIARRLRRIVSWSHNGAQRCVCQVVQNGDHGTRNIGERRTTSTKY